MPRPKRLTRLWQSIGLHIKMYERLLTGRLAEEYFLANSLTLINVLPRAILDLRQKGGGYDFGVHDHPEWAIEVKGIKQSRGEIQFTEREWLEAGLRTNNYWVVVIGNLMGQPTYSIFRNPHARFKCPQ